MQELVSVMSTAKLQNANTTCNKREVNQSFLVLKHQTMKANIGERQCNSCILNLDNRWTVVSFALSHPKRKRLWYLTGSES
jgi:hypothetical protein